MTHRDYRRGKIAFGLKQMTVPVGEPHKFQNYPESRQNEPFLDVHYNASELKTALMIWTGANAREITPKRKLKHLPYGEISDVETPKGVAKVYRDEIRYVIINPHLIGQ